MANINFCNKNYFSELQLDVGGAAGREQNAKEAGSDKINSNKS